MKKLILLAMALVIAAGCTTKAGSAGPKKIEAGGSTQIRGSYRP